MKERFSPRFEHWRQPVLAPRAYYLRVLGHVLLSLIMVAVSWGIGILGYHFFGNFPGLIHYTMPR